VDVEVRVNALDVHSCDDRVRETFEGTWTVDLAGNPVLSNADIAQIGNRQLAIYVPEAATTSATAALDAPLDVATASTSASAS
jgi:hypothetical protein